MAIQEFFTSRNNGVPTGNTFVGQEGRLWYDPLTNTIRVSDGSTPGGTIVSGGGGGGAANVAVSYQGNLLTSTLTSLDFTGDGVVATNIGNAVTVSISGGGSFTGLYLLDGGDPDQSYICGPVPAKIGFEWDGGNCVDLGGVTA
jgi:hypothetical protein